MPILVINASWQASSELICTLYLLFGIIQNICLKEMNQQLEQELHKKIKEYFYKGFNSRLIHYLIQRNNNYDISYSCLVRKLLPRLGLKRRLAEIDLDDVFEKSQIEIQNGCAGSENLRRTLKMKYHFNVTRSISREIVKILDEDGVRRRKHRRLRRRQYFSRMDMISLSHSELAFMGASMGFLEE